MKKKLLAFCMLFALLIGAIGGISAFADVSLEECDKCFQTTVNAFLNDDDVEGSKINALRKPVYDIKLQQLGYVYEFEIVSGNGYAIIICDDGNYIAQEFVPSAESPYAQVGEDELCVYINSMTYLKHNGVTFLDILTSEEVSAEVMASFEENAIVYKDSYARSAEKETVTINYQSRETDSKSLSKRVPRFTTPGGMPSPCAAVAATNIIGFYDRYHEELIPDHTAGFESYGYYLYNAADEYVYNTMRELYSLMNGSEAGISEANFKKGMKEYCENKNLCCDFTQLLSSGKLSFSNVKQSIDDNIPVALLLSTYTVCDISTYSGYDKFVYDKYSGDHIMVGFGYTNLTYTLTDGTQSNYEFVYVASGFTAPMNAYFNMNYSTNINSAYKVYIH